MVKWADYQITSVRYNKEETHVIMVLAHADFDDKFGDSSIWGRHEVLEALNSRTTFITVTYDENNKPIKGALIEPVKIDDKYYIKTIPDNTKKDNLGGLPPF
jgi:hypothetical protein